MYAFFYKLLFFIAHDDHFVDAYNPVVYLCSVLETVLLFGMPQVVCSLFCLQTYGSLHYRSVVMNILVQHSPLHLC